MITQDDRQKIFELAHQNERIAGEAFSRAQKQYPHRSPEFNQAYHDYVSAMQKVRNMYYLASHTVTQAVAAGEDLNNIARATEQLQDSLVKLKNVETGVAITLKILTVVVTVTACVENPTLLPAALKAVSDLVAEVAAATSKGSSAV
jgi:hypothetical protein